MTNAVYYPSTDVTSPLVLKNALLLWDTLEAIVPRTPWAPRRVEDPLLNEAVDLVVRHRVPGTEEQLEVDTVLKGMASEGCLSDLIDAEDRRFGHYTIVLGGKFGTSTWELLEHMAKPDWSQSIEAYHVPAALGLLMMSLLADACAPVGTPRVTDRVDAYTWLGRQRARVLGRPHTKGLEPHLITTNCERLLTLSIEALDARSISLKSLVELRKRELASGGDDYRVMRRNYQKHLRQYLERLGSIKKATDVRDVERQFKEDIRDDVKDLRRELRLAGTKALFTKELVGGVALAVGAPFVSTPWLAALAKTIGILGTIPLAGRAIELNGARATAFRKHTSSWLYLSQENTLQAI